MVEKKHRLPKNVHLRPDGKKEVRVTYTEGAKRKALHQVLKYGEDPAKIAREMRVAIQRKAAGEPRPIPLTFASLAKRFEASEMQPAVVRDGKVVSGRKSLYIAKLYLQSAIDHWGHRNPKHISYAELKEYKIKRLNTPVVSKFKSRPRSLGAVNRELSFLRGIFSFAVREGYLDKNPFTMGAPLINVGDEKPRQVLWTYEEEKHALSLCTGKRRHLKPIIICITYGGFRVGELLNLEWHEVNFTQNIITIPAHKTKANREKKVPMHEKVAEALSLWKIDAPDGKRVFPYNSVKTAWKFIREKIDRPDLRLYDLRSVFASRLYSNGVQLKHIAKLLGHSTESSIADRFYVIVSEDELADSLGRL